MKKILVILALSSIPALQASGASRQASRTSQQVLNAYLRGNAAMKGANPNALVVRTQPKNYVSWTDRVKARLQLVGEASEKYGNDLRNALFGAIAVTAAGKVANDQFSTNKAYRQGIIDNKTAQMHKAAQQAFIQSINAEQKRITGELSNIKYQWINGHMLGADYKALKEEFAEQFNLLEQQKRQAEMQLGQ